MSQQIQHLLTAIDAGQRRSREQYLHIPSPASRDAELSLGLAFFGGVLVGLLLALALLNYTVAHAAEPDALLGFVNADPAPITEVQTRAVPRNKFETVLMAAKRTPMADGLDPEIIATICIHESGFMGSRYGFGIVSPFAFAGGERYLTHSDPTAAVEYFLQLVSESPRYETAWSVRDDSQLFLQLIVRAGYAEDKAWAGKILWLRGYLVNQLAGL